MLFYSCSAKTKYLDEYGDIKGEHCKSYFAMINEYMLKNSEIDENKLLPDILENELIEKLQGWNIGEFYSLSVYDFADNIVANNYFVIQSDLKHGLYEVHIPKSYDTEEGGKIWKCYINVIFLVKNNKIVNYHVLREVTYCKFIIKNNELHYITVDSSFGMNYTQIYYQVYDMNDLSLKVNELVFSTGSVVPSVIVFWKQNVRKILFEGFSHSESELMFEKYYKEIDLTSVSS